MHLTRSALAKCAAAALLMAALSCTKEDNTPDNTPVTEDSTRRTGWKGDNEREDTVPKNVNHGSNPFGNTTLPQSMDLTQYLPPIGNQGNFGTCVAWAAGYNMKTAIEAIKFSRTSSQLSQAQFQMSPKDLFIAIDDNVKGANDCNGTNFTPALDVILNRGVATQAVVPYNLTSCEKSLQQAAWNTDAAKHKLSRYRRIDPTIDAIKQELFNKSPVVLGAKLADNFNSWTAADVVYSSHSTFDQVGIHAYHAMLIVGYDDTKGPRGAFKVVNSWGDNWGATGHIWVDQQFMVNGFMFDRNLFSAANDDQKPDSTGPNPQPNPAGVDLIPWVTSDFAAPQSGNPTRRQMVFDLYNIGTSPSQVSSGSGYAYIYYNAYDANEYGVIFYDYQSPQPSAGNADCAALSGDLYPGCRVNVPVPSGGSLGTELFNDNILRTYSTPTTLNGEYYLLLYADVNEKHPEQDESNNLFYTTDQYPIYFEDGVEWGRKTPSPRSALSYNFQNPLKASAKLSKEARRFRTAVKPNHPNAYTPKEIIGFLKNEVKNGGFRRKLDEYKRRTAGQPQDIARAVR